MRWLIGIPFLVVLLLFTLSNRQNVDLALWPTDFTLQAPLAIAMLVAGGLAFVLGALITWFAGLGHRRRARRAEDTVRLLEAQVQTLKSRPPVTMPVNQGLSRLTDG